MMVYLGNSCDMYMLTRFIGVLLNILDVLNLVLSLMSQDFNNILLGVKFDEL